MVMIVRDIDDSSIRNIRVIIRSLLLRVIYSQCL
jgi:hypothetical protein